MTRSMPPTVSLPQRLAACALVMAGALCVFATGEGLRLRFAAVEPLAGTAAVGAPASGSVESGVAVTSAGGAVANARANLSKAIEAFARADADEAARFALAAQDDLAAARAQADAHTHAAAIAEVEAGLQSLREQGLSREEAQRDAPPLFDFFRGFRDWGNPDADTGDADDAAPSAHPLGPARPLANGRHIMASTQDLGSTDRHRVETRRA